MRSVQTIFRGLFIPAVLLLGACCTDKPVVVSPPPPPLPPPIVHPVLGDVFYDFDKSGLRQDAVEQLKTNAKWFQESAGRKAVIEGHCDERGTNEYNLALGERRANSARDYLVHVGIEPARLKTVSYGEERPFAVGHNEEAWAQNRRAHFVAE